MVTLQSTTQLLWSDYLQGTATFLVTGTQAASKTFQSGETKSKQSDEGLKKIEKNYESFVLCFAGIVSMW